MPLVHDESSGPSVLQGRNEADSGGMSHHSGSLHRLSGPSLPTTNPSTDDIAIQQLQQLVATRRAEIIALRTAQDPDKTLGSQVSRRSANAEERSISHAEVLNKAIVELETTIAPFLPANMVPQPGTRSYGGSDLAERLRPGCLTQIGVVRFATWKLQNLRDIEDLERREDETRRRRSNNPSPSSAHVASQEPNNPSSSTYEPGTAQVPEHDSGSKMEEEDLGATGEAALDNRA